MIKWLGIILIPRFSIDDDEEFICLFFYLLFPNIINFEDAIRMAFWLVEYNLFWSICFELWCKWLESLLGQKRWKEKIILPHKKKIILPHKSI